MKIQDFLGNIGGFVDCLIFLFEILKHDYVEFNYKIKSYNSITSYLSPKTSPYTTEKFIISNDSASNSIMKNNFSNYALTNKNEYKLEEINPKRNHF